MVPTKDICVIDLLFNNKSIKNLKRFPAVLAQLNLSYSSFKVLYLRPNDDSKH